MPRLKVEPEVDGARPYQATYFASVSRTGRSAVSRPAASANAVAACSATPPLWIDGGVAVGEAGLPGRPTSKFGDEGFVAAPTKGGPVAVVGHDHVEMASGIGHGEGAEHRGLGRGRMSWPSVAGLEADQAGESNRAAVELRSPLIARTRRGRPEGLCFSPDYGRHRRSEVAGVCGRRWRWPKPPTRRSSTAPFDLPAQCARGSRRARVDLWLDQAGHVAGPGNGVRPWPGSDCGRRRTWSCPSTPARCMAVAFGRGPLLFLRDIVLSPTGRAGVSDANMAAARTGWACRSAFNVLGQLSCRHAGTPSAHRTRHWRGEHRMAVQSATKRSSGRQAKGSIVVCSLTTTSMHITILICGRS